MKSGLRLIALLLLFADARAQQSPPATQSSAPPTVILVLRHAEKATQQPGDDPSLSEAGAKRAQDFIGVAEAAGVTAIYATNYKRTKETAVPLAKRLSIPVIGVDYKLETRDDFPAVLAKRILRERAGQTVAFIGHSNLVPLVVEALGGKRPPAINDAAEFDKLFVVIIDQSGAAKTINTRYGAPSVVP